MQSCCTDMEHAAASGWRLPTGGQGMLYRPLLVMICFFAVTGCNFGRVSLGLNRDHKIPIPSVNVLPVQWEPDQADSVVE